MISTLKQSTSLTVIVIALFSVVSYVGSGCYNANANSNDYLAQENKTIPKLLVRNSKIQNGNEWDQVQNYYAEQLNAIEADENNNEAKLNLAMLFVKEARVTGEHGHYYPAALALSKNILKNNDLNPDLKFRALMTKAGIILSLHEFAEAKEIGLQALQLNPKNAQIYGILVDCYIELGEYDNAIKMADKMINIKPDIRSYSRVSYLREIYGDIAGSMKAMKLAIEAGFPGTEETAWAMQKLAELYQLYEQPTQAKQIYENILQTRKDYPFALYGLASIELEHGSLEVSKRINNKAIEIIPEVSFYIQLAEIYKAEGWMGELEKTTKQIMEMLADDVAHGHNMNLEYAKVYLELLENPDAALNYAEIEYQKRPDNIDVNRLMALIYKSKSEISKSKEYKFKALKTGSVHPELDEI